MQEILSRKKAGISALFAATLAVLLFFGAGAQANPPEQAEPQAQRTVEVQILGLNETHGQLTPLRRSGRLAGGAATLAAYLAREEAENPRTLILDSGDFMQGPAISSYFQGESTVEVFNAMGVDAVAVGNHEFDWGRPILEQRMAQADFAFLANNILEDATGAPPAGMAPYKVFKLQGAEVGVIGVGNPDTKNITLPAATQGLTFLDMAATAQAVDAAVMALQNQKVEAIVLVTHLGLTSPSSGGLADLLNSLSPSAADEIDFVLAGHIPLEFQTQINGMPVIQPFGNTRGYADVTLTIDRATKDVVGYRGQTKATWVDAITPDAQVQAIVDRYQVIINAELGKVVGQASSSITRAFNAESEMGNFITDTQRTYLAGIDFAFQNAGGLRRDIDAGPITLEEIYAVLPFNNTLVIMDLTGAQVRQVLEEGAASRYGVVQVSGLKWTFDDAAPFGSRVTQVTLPDGTPIDPAATYRIATNNFMAAGGDQFNTLKAGANTIDTGVNLVEAVVKYLEAQSPVDPQVEGRLTIL